MRGVLEAATKPNLEKKIRDLLPEDVRVLQINDKKLNHTLRVRLVFSQNETNGMSVDWVNMRSPTMWVQQQGCFQNSEQVHPLKTRIWNMPLLISHFEFDFVELLCWLSLGCLLDWPIRAFARHWNAQLLLPSHCCRCCGKRRRLDRRGLGRGIIVIFVKLEALAGNQCTSGLLMAKSPRRQFVNNPWHDDCPFKNWTN